jgi:serine/threonine protein kinase
VPDPRPSSPSDVEALASASARPTETAPPLPTPLASSVTLPAATQDSGRARSDSFAPGMLIAEKYVVERVLGEGGIGIVVAAKHIDLDQTVAIKYLRPQALAGGNAADRFLREARLAAKIRSDHVVRVYDVGRLPDGAPYMVMEYLAGTDLGRILVTGGRLPLDRAVDYILQTCEALAEAHVAGVVHRDLKPDNLFVATGAAGKSVLKILDFGISKLSAKRTTSDRLDVLTKADDKFGTPVYMSPEQLRASRDVDTRADVWAVGVVLYELLTGFLPFDGDGLPELCTAILTLPPVPLSQHRPDLPAALQGVIERCLEKEADRRFQNVAELAQELRPFTASSSRARIDHVVNIIRETGEVIRPPTPVPGDSTSRLLSHATTLGAPEARDLLTTGSAAASSRGILGELRVTVWKRRRAALLGGAGVLALTVLAFVRLVSPTAGSAAPATSSITVDVGHPEPSVASAPPPATAAADSAAAVESLPATAPPVPTPRAAHVGPLHGHPKTAPAASSSGAHAKKAAPASSTFDSSGVINPFE